MTRSTLVLTLTVAVASFLTACGDASAPSTSLAPSARSLDFITTEVDVVISAEEYALADVNGVNGICVKGTSSGNALLKDANDATPSQPCPPAWQFIGKPQGIKVHKEWLSEDKNANGVVCVKFVGVDKTIVKDDNTNTPSQPCPPSYSPVGSGKKGPNADAEDLQAADEDADGMVCVNAVGSGNFIVRDDNNATPSQPCPPAWFVVTTGGAAPPADPAEPSKD